MEYLPDKVNPVKYIFTVVDVYLIQPLGLTGKWERMFAMCGAARHIFRV
jgi:hypothetical protein